MIQNIFNTPLWSFQLQASEKDYENAIQYCINLSKTHLGKKLSNVGGWQSENFLFNNIIDTPLLLFFEQIVKFSNSILNDLNPDFCFNTQKKITAWINVNGKGDYNVRHDHCGHNLSGVFYLTNSNSNITFYRHDDYTNLFLRSFLIYDSSYQIISYQPSQGQTLIFPSMLQHDVSVNKELTPRVSVSFNI